jgi:hypothetical protein
MWLNGYRFNSRCFWRVKAAKEFGLIHPSMGRGRGVSLMDILFVAKASGFVICMSLVFIQT